MLTSEIYNFSLFKDVEEGLIEDLINRHPIIFFPAETQLIKKDEFNKKVFLLLQGSVSVRDKNNNPVIRLDSCSIFGEISVLDAKPASATVVTLTNCRALVITEEELWALSKHSHAFTVNLLQLVVERLRSFSSQLDQSKDSAKSMQKKAFLDSSTGLFNRTWLDEKSATIISYHKNQSSPLSFIMTDIDHFKQVNDIYGHDVGDLVLKEVAQILKHSSQKNTYTVRLGGDEMCIILPGISLEVTTEIANKACKVIEKFAFELADSKSLNITSSFGVSTLIDDMGMVELMKLADIALYKAKVAGRNQVSTYDNSTSDVV